MAAARIRATCCAAGRMRSAAAPRGIMRSIRIVLGAGRWGPGSRCRQPAPASRRRRVRDEEIGRLAAAGQQRHFARTAIFLGDANDPPPGGALRVRGVGLANPLDPLAVAAAHGRSGSAPLRSPARCGCARKTAGEQVLWHGDSRVGLGTTLPGGQ